jgi:putative transposase
VAIATLICHYNNHRYHECLDDLTPVDVYFGRGETVFA